MMEACGKNPNDLTVNSQRLLDDLDRHNISKAVVLCFNAKRTLGVHVTNEFVAKLCLHNPDKLIGFVSFDAFTGLTNNNIRNDMERLNLKGFKIPYGYLNMSPLDPRWLPLYQDASHNKLPVLVYIGYSPIKKVNIKHCHPMSLEKVAQEFPEMKIIIAHLAWPWIDEMSTY